MLEWLKKLEIKYVIIGDLLYRNSFDGVFLRCLIRHEIDIALHHAHDGECDGHFNSQLVYQ